MSQHVFVSVLSRTTVYVCAVIVGGLFLMKLTPGPPWLAPLATLTYEAVVLTVALRLLNRR